MKLNLFFSSPLEKFRVLPLMSFSIGGFDFSLTNEFVIFVDDLS